MIFDTCYFIDAQRKPEVIREVTARSQGQPLWTTIVTFGELAEGMANPTEAALETAILGMSVLGIDQQTALVYGHIRRLLRQTGQMIGANDLWIASIALANQMPVITRNGNEFDRVPGLRVMGY
jgi:tRNA(fMet)-specific endonuclease VapC